MHQRRRNVFGSPALRLVQLHMLLKTSNRTYSLTRLADLFGCSRQAVLRMMEQLSLVQGLEIESWRDGRERRYRVVQPPSPPHFSLTSDTIRYMTLCSDILRHLLPPTVQQELSEALGVTVDTLAGADQSPAHPVAEPWTKGRIDYGPFQSVLDGLQDAMHQRRLCKIAYNSHASRQRRTYLAAPLRIISYHEALYLRARLYDAPQRPADDFRTFAIHRIADFRLHPDTFQDSPHDDREPSFGFPFHEPLSVRVAFTAEVAPYVAERTWSPDQTIKKRRNGSIELTFTTTSRLEVIAWVLSFGPDAELLEPQDLREEVAGQVKKLMAVYAHERRGK